MVLHDIITSWYISKAAMSKQKKIDEVGVWNFRDVPREVIVKAKIEAALEGKSVKSLLMELVDERWRVLEKNGLIPKGR